MRVTLGAVFGEAESVFTPKCYREKQLRARLFGGAGTEAEDFK